MQPIEIVEILRPADQGRTTPFLCRADDEMLYYVKGKKAGRRSQYCEWVVAHLGQSFGLPIPPFRLVRVSAELMAESPASQQALGAGLAFASLAQSKTQWFENSFVGQVHQDMRCDVLAFDWWIQNMDRLNDNTNLLWDASAKKLVVIDHDVAFEDGFWPSLFLTNHVFAEDWNAIVGNEVRKNAYLKRMSDSLSIWDAACESAPEVWRFKEYGDAAEALFDSKSALEKLQICATSDLWSLK